MFKMFVIGSLTQEKQIARVANSLADDFEVKYVRKETGKSFEELVKQAFDNIEWADTIVVICKPDETIGKGTTYEVEYAKRLGKKVLHLVPISDERNQFEVSDNSKM